jgi:hypothetical protein
MEDNKMIAELHRNLTSGEYRRITARLNLYHWLQLMLTRKTEIGKTPLYKSGMPTKIILMKNNGNARLSYESGHHRYTNWNGPRRAIKIEVGKW